MSALDGRDVPSLSQKLSGLADSDDENSDDDDDLDLEVLPPSKQLSKSSGNSRGPRLSASGNGALDPIALLDEEEEDWLERSTSRHKKLLHPTASQPVKSATVNLTVNSTRPASQNLGPTHYDSSDDSSSASSDDSLARTIRAFQTSKPMALPQIHTRKAPPKTTGTAALSQTSKVALSQQSSLSQPGTSTTTSKKRPPRATSTQVAERQAHRLQKQQEREHAKAVKEQERLAVKRARQAKKDAEQADKRRRQALRDENRQQKGQYANKEIVVLMDSELFRHPELTLVDELQEQKYMVVEHASMLGCKTVQFIRKDLILGEGGAEGALEAMRAGNRDGYEHIDVVAVVFDKAMDFIKLLERDQNEEDDYPKLEEWLQSIQCGWRASWKCPPKTQPRIILYLYKVTHTLEQLWIEHKRKKQPTYMAPPSDEELKDALAWLLIQFQVECVECREVDHLQMEMNRLTCKLSDVQYRKTYSNLDVSQKLAPLCGADASLYDQAKDCWLRQVQQVPRVSFNAARALVQHYPTGYSLWRTYQDPNMTEDEKRLLLANCFGGDRAQAKVSEHMYRLMTSENPNDLLI